MTQIQTRTFSTVELIQQVGDDSMIANAARVSTGRDLTADHSKDGGLIHYLMKNKHGSPFEHGSATFRIETPIFVVREFHRHRVGWSYNETSGRYRELDPVFYLPADDRPLVQEGSSAHPKLVAGDQIQHANMSHAMRGAYSVAWDIYQEHLKNGVAKEVARMCLPVGIFTSFYATANPRSIMHFLGLRLAENAQYEIRLVARQIEAIFAEKWPITHQAWVENGRVAP